ncbi:FAD-dependent oxidoreductase [Pseudonocardia sichuanensis]
MGTSTQWDVVVVGGGIAGSALATVLATDGYRVAVLERQTSYRDKVRGEVLCCWGVDEALRLELEKPLLDAGGSYVTRHVPYDEAVEPARAEAMAVPLDRLLPGVPGAMGVGHPEACESLARAAAAAGATVVRGVGDVDVEPGPAPVVRYEHDDVLHELRCRLVVGADGRMSTVRRRLGIPLQQTVPRTMGGGMLVDDLHSWPSERGALGTEDDLLYFVFPRAGGRVRLYFVHDIAQRGRFAGPDREAAFLAAYGLRCIPGSSVIQAATPAGPCIFYPMNDSWTDRVSAPGVVLVGDAAGWNDPVIGQGLSIALRDARIVADILRTGPDWSERAFTPYARERRERMRRLRIAARVTTDLQCTFTRAGIDRRRAYLAVLGSDPVLAGSQRVKHLGPENVPAEAFAQPTIDRILALT